MAQITVKLKEQEFKGKLNFAVIGKTQAQLKKQGTKLKFQELFKEIEEQNFLVINELIIQSIQACHPQVRRDFIEDELTFEVIEPVFEYLAELVQSSMPQDDKKK